MKIEKVVTSPLSGRKYFVRVVFNTDLVERDHIEYDIFVYEGTKPTRSIFGVETQKPHVIHESYQIETDEHGRLKEDLNPDRDISNLIIMYEAPYIYKTRLEAWDGVVRLEDRSEPEPEPEPTPEPTNDDEPIVINWYDPPEVREEKLRLAKEREQAARGQWIIDIETERDASPTDPPAKRKRKRNQRLKQSIS